MLTAAAVSGCAHTRPRNEVFASPERFLERDVTVCGQITDSSNIVEDGTGSGEVRPAGLSILEGGPLNLRFRGRICVEGPINYVGCKTGTAICTDWAYDYGIRIRRVIERGAALRQDARLANSASEPAAASVPRGPMSYETCATSSSCVVRGIATARLAERAPMAQFDLPDGRCINVSLPPRRLAMLRRDGPAEMTVTGEVYREPYSPGEETVLQIEGRTIGFGRCGAFFVFVPDRQE